MRHKSEEWGRSAPIFRSPPPAFLSVCLLQAPRLHPDAKRPGGERPLRAAGGGQLMPLPPGGSPEGDLSPVQPERSCASAPRPPAPPPVRPSSPCRALKVSGAAARERWELQPGPSGLSLHRGSGRGVPGGAPVPEERQPPTPAWTPLPRVPTAYLHTRPSSAGIRASAFLPRARFHQI